MQQGGEKNRGKIFSDIAEKGVIDVIDTSAESFDCNDEILVYFTAILSSVLLVLLILSSATAALRNEIYILYRRSKSVETVPRSFNL